METIKLYYTTELGSAHLGTEVEVSPSTYKEVIDSYVTENQPIANTLVDKWKSNGETKCGLFLDVENINTSKELYGEIYRYVVIHY